MITVREYLDADGHSQYRTWFDGLDVPAATKVSLLSELLKGTCPRLKEWGKASCESRIDFGPGYRVYLGKDGEQLVILLGGGTKKRQDRDIEDAKEAWQKYKTQKKAALKQAAAKAAMKTKRK